MFFRCLTESIWTRLFTIHEIHAITVSEGEPARVRARRDALMFDGQAAPIRLRPKEIHAAPVFGITLVIIDTCDHN